MADTDLSKESKTRKSIIFSKFLILNPRNFLEYREGVTVKARSM